MGAHGEVHTQRTGVAVRGQASPSGYLPCPIRRRRSSAPKQEPGTAREAVLVAEHRHGVHWLPLLPGRPWRAGQAERPACSSLSIAQDEWGAGTGRHTLGASGLWGGPRAGSQNPSRPSAPGCLRGRSGTRPKRQGPAFRFFTLDQRRRPLLPCPNPALRFWVPSAWRQAWPTVSMK